MLLSRLATRPALDAALSYVRCHGWAVVPGCDQGRRGRRCGRDDCLTADPHPATEHLVASRDEATVRRWWRRGPHATVLLPTGHGFDVLDVPPDSADAALERVRTTGYHLGPVAHTVGGRLLIWVRPGARVFAELHDRRSWPYASVGLRCHGAGGFVVAPPCGGSTWLSPPAELAMPTLPHCADILPALVQACR